MVRPGEQPAEEACTALNDDEATVVSSIEEAQWRAGVNRQAQAGVVQHQINASHAAAQKRTLAAEEKAAADKRNADKRNAAKRLKRETEMCRCGADAPDAVLTRTMTRRLSRAQLHRWVRGRQHRAARAAAPRRRRGRGTRTSCPRARRVAARTQGARITWPTAAARRAECGSAECGRSKVSSA